MITINAIFWMFVVMFAVVGAMRGWAKELLVTFSVILGIFIIVLMEQFITFMNVFLLEGGAQRQFTTRAAILGAMIVFGYQTPNIRRLSEVLVRERFQDSLLGIFIGAINAYFIFGSLWYYLHQLGYPFEWVVQPSDPAALEFLAYLPPVWLGIPAIYFAVAIAFIFVVVVLI